MYRKSSFYKKYNLSTATMDEGNDFKIKTLEESFKEEGFQAEDIHTHDFYTIFWFRKGGGTHNVDFVNYDIHDDSIICLAPGQLHTFNYPTIQEGYVIEFSQYVFSHERSADSLYTKYSFFYTSTPCRRIASEDAVILENIIRTLYAEKQKMGQYAHRDLMEMLLAGFLITLQRSQMKSGEIPAESDSSQSPSARTYIRFREALENEFQKHHTVQAYAAILGISTKSLTSAVLEFNGTTPLTMINDRITLEAKRLLRFSTMIVKEIAFTLGFEDPSYFIKFFKKHTGKLPKEYRALHTANQQ